MFVVKATGLVPVTSKQRGGRTGIFGVKPDTARKGVLEGTLALVEDIPNHIEVDVVAGPTSPVIAVDVDVVDEGPVIPADWAYNEESKDFVDGAGKTVHSLKRIAVAQKISGVDIVLTDDDKAAEVKKTDKADAIILAEIQRRAAADNQTE